MNLPAKHNQEKTRSTTSLEAQNKKDKKQHSKPGYFTFYDIIEMMKARQEEEQSKLRDCTFDSVPKSMNEYQMSFDEEEEFKLMECYVEMIKAKQTLQKTESADYMSQQVNEKSDMKAGSGDERMNCLMNKEPTNQSGPATNADAETDEAQSELEIFAQNSVPKYLNGHQISFDEEEELRLMESYVRMIKNMQDLSKTERESFPVTEGSRDSSMENKNSGEKKKKFFLNMKSGKHIFRR